MLKVKAFVYVMLVTAVGLFLFNGCSIIGLGIGALSDALKPDQLVIQGWQVLTVKPGKPIKIFLTDGDSLSGTFIGREQISQEDYYNRYLQYRQSTAEDITMPMLGDSLTITLTSGLQFETELLGFDYEGQWVNLIGNPDSVYVKLRERNIKSIKLHNEIVVGEEEIKRYSEGIFQLNTINTLIDKNGNVLDGAVLRELTTMGRVPFTSVILIQNKAGTNRVAMNNIYQIQALVEKHGMRTGFFVGLTVDLLFIVSLAISWGEPIF